MGEGPAWLRRAWVAALLVAVASRAWNALTMPVLRGYDSTGHVSYALFLDLYRAVPFADQGWSYFHPPLHYVFGWALAQAGSAELLVRGLALVAGAASLTTALLGAWVVRLGLPGRPGLALLAFLAVTFLPVHVYSSGMPGNELTAALFASAAVALFLRNESRERPGLAGDAAAGLAIGLALLTKFSGLLALLVVVATLGLATLRRSGEGLRRGALRGGLILGVALLVCSPYYARNLSEFDTPFQLSRDFPLVAAVEGEQPPGERSFRDLFSFPLRAFSEPDPEAEHMLGSIPGSVYLNAWVDGRPDIDPPLARSLMLAGLVPTGLALLGLLACLRTSLRGGSVVELAVTLLGLASVGSLLIMAYRVPTFAMLKASYLLGGSIAYGYAVARGIAALDGGPARAAVVLVLVACALSAIAATPGWLYPRGGENERMASVHAYFGDHDRAEAIYRGRIPEVERPERRTLMRDYLASLLIEADEPAAAREVFDKRKRVFGAPPHLPSVTSPWWLNRRAVATALAGDPSAARDLLDRAFEFASVPEPPLRVNRAAVRVLQGDLPGAAEDLARALEVEPGLAAAHDVLAFVQERRGDMQSAQRSRQEAARLAWLPPRGFPYGVGNGFNLNGQRFLLVIEDGVLTLYRPARSRAGQ